MMGTQKRNKFSWLLAGLLILSPCGRSHARSQKPSTPGHTNEDSSVISCPLYLVTVEVEVSDPRKEEASSLGRGDFTVYEDGVEQQIIFWAEAKGAGAGGVKAVYAMAYRPMIIYDGRFHKIRVVARGAGGRKLRVRLLTPKGYDAVRL
jgi:hypothetical protein